MFADEARDCAISLAHVSEETPFGPEVLVYKVGGKMFALISPDDVPAYINLKCDPARALDLRAEHEGIRPGYHMNKQHWNTVNLNGTLPKKLVTGLIEHSYALVVAGLPRKVKTELGLA